MNNKISNLLKVVVLLSMISGALYVFDYFINTYNEYEYENEDCNVTDLSRIKIRIQNETTKPDWYEDTQDCDIYIYKNGIDIVYMYDDGDTVFSQWEIVDNGVAIVGSMGRYTRYSLDWLYKQKHTKNFIMYNISGSYVSDYVLKIAKEINEKGYNTVVPKNGSVASSGVDFFVGGVTRKFSKESILEIHSWVDMQTGDFGADLPKDHPGHKLYLEYYSSINLPEDFYWFSLNPPKLDSDGFYRMSVEDIKKYLGGELID